jgi:predicted porin
LGQSSFTDANDRLDNALSFSFAYLVIPNLVVQPFYRVQYTYYSHFSDNTFNVSAIDSEKGRNDLLNDFGVTLFYQFNKNFAARVFVDYEVQNSDYKAIPDSVEFHNLNAGAGLSLDVRF